jgi:hypothetical protein
MLCICTKMTNRGEQDCHTDMDVEADEVVGGGRGMDHFETYHHGRGPGGFMAQVHAGHSDIGEVLIHHRSLGRRCHSQMTAKS